MWFPELFSRVEKYGGSPCDHHGPIMENITINTNTSNVICEPPEDWVFFSGFLTALSNLPGNLFTIFLMDKIGRKVILGE